MITTIHKLIHESLPTSQGVSIFRTAFTNSKFSMKTFFVIAFAMLTFSACTKQDSAAVQPDRARKMAGTYEVNLLTFQVDSKPAISQPFPAQFNGQPIMSASITITRKTESTVDQTMAFTFNKSAFPAGIDLSMLKDENYTFDNMEIRNNGTGYDLYADGKKVAYFDDDVYTVQRADTDPRTGMTFNVGLRAKK